MVGAKGARGLLLVLYLVAIGRVVVAGIACLSNPCLHGICIDDVNSTYACYCVDGYTGVQCQTNWDECWSSPCQNGGTCIDGIASYNCSCPDGFIGENCETNYDECESNPCQNNGTCIDMTNSYMCSCLIGYTGDHCEVDVAVCNSSSDVRCYNGGECVEGPGYKFYCRCLSGWKGAKCDEPVDECESNPCQNNGICLDLHADFMCACAFGYTGKRCEVKIEFCGDSSCSNNALCVVEDGERVCYCVPDYHGERCELQYDECLLGPGCMNGGTCIDGVDNYTCSCPPGVSGTNCECTISDDDTTHCESLNTSFTRPVTEAHRTTTLYEGGTTTEIITSSSFIHEITDITSITSITSTHTAQTEKNIEYTDLTIKDSLTNSTQTSTEKTVYESTDAITTTISESATDLLTTTNQIDTTPETNNNNAITTPESITVIPDISSTNCGVLCEGRELTDRPVKFLDNKTLVTEPVTTTLTSTSVDATEKITDDLTTTTVVALTTSSVVDTTTQRKETITTQSKEESSTTKFDVITDKLFTETPTESTDLTTTTFASTTEFVDTTSSPNITFPSSTVFDSECSESVCNYHGLCVITVHGIQCQCEYNYSGRYCDENVLIKSAAFSKSSYIMHKLRNTTSIYIELEAKTLTNDGHILLVDIARDVYMSLYIKMGLLKFKFSCGYQTMLLSELKTYVNKGYPMKIETRLDLYLNQQHCNASLHLNNTVAMSGGQVANVSTLDHNMTLYLGNSPTLKEHQEPFIGCIKNLRVNGENRDIFGDAVEADDISECVSLSCLSSPCLSGGICRESANGFTCSCANGWMGDRCQLSVCDHNPCQFGGTCVRYPGSGFLCLCPYGKHGMFCEYNVEITKPSFSPVGGLSSYITYGLPSSVLSSERFDLRFRFQTTDMNQIALLAFIGQSGQHDSRSPHLAVTFVKGYIMLTWNMGSGPRRIFTPRPISDRRSGHTVRVGRRGRSAWLNVDSRYNVSGNAPGIQNKMPVLPLLYIGGHGWLSSRVLPHDLPLHAGWSGCVWEVGGAGGPRGGRGAGQCGVGHCSSSQCHHPQGVCIHSPATYGCICNEGWFGATCSATQNPCDPNVTKCQGECVITSSQQSRCDCFFGKTGLDCEEDLIPSIPLFTGIRSFIRLHPRMLSSVSVSLEAEIRPTKARGLLVYASTPHFYVTLSMQGGLLEFRWTDLVSGVTSLVRSSVVVTMSSWHRVKAGRYGTRLFLWLDGTINTDNMLAHTYPHTINNATFDIGGADDLSTLPEDVMSGPPESYLGCLKNFHINNMLVPFDKESVNQGRNVQECGDGCGPECTGSGCSSQCACAAGRCGRGAAGNDGSKNITVPKFNGNSLISLLRKKTYEGYQDQQRITSTSQRPNHISLKFSTVELSGTLIWIDMDLDYIAIGLENGYLKLAWSVQSQEFTQRNSIKFKEDKSFKLLHSAGFVADGHWYQIVMKLVKNNISIMLNDKTVFSAEINLKDDEEYEFVDLVLGGSSSPAAKEIFSNNFIGCIDDIVDSGNGTRIVDFTDYHTENIEPCQLII